MKTLYSKIIIILIAIFATGSVWAGSWNTNAPSNGSKATLKAVFATDNKSVVVMDTNSNTAKIQQVILNFEDGSQEMITSGLNVSKTGSLKGSSIYTGYVIIGVWVSDGTNNRITVKDSSGYGHYITNTDNSTKNNDYQGYQTDLGKVSSNNAKNSETKVEICHVPPGNPDNRHTIWISQSALQAHLDNHCSKDHTGQNICDQVGECGGGGIIPVDLISFNAKKLNPMEVELTWATASEINNDHFTIERTTDMATWTPVCRVDGNGNSAEIREYSCTDHTAGAAGGKTLYYRPMQVDFNGAYEYFNVIKLRLESTDQPNAVNSIYPNPAIDRINIQYHASENGVVNIRLLSIEGKLVLTSSYKVNSGQQTVDINLPEDKLAKGMYLLEVESEGLVHREKVYKQ